MTPNQLRAIRDTHRETMGEPTMVQKGTGFTIKGDGEWARDADGRWVFIPEDCPACSGPDVAKPKFLSCAETAKFVRATLKAEWPDTKFSVRSKTYSGGASMNVEWTDGPTRKAVENICGPFQGADFDGMIDLKTNRGPCEALGGAYSGADYIFCDREYSDEAWTTAAHAVAGKFGMDEVPAREDAWKVQVVSNNADPHWSLDNQVRRYLEGLD